ncbi:MAG: 30S ribosomal protein S8 [Candidatus Gracilibacteria bacterium]
MTTDPISDLFVSLHNALIVGKGAINVPHSSLKERILNILKKNKYIVDFVTQGDIKKTILITLDDSRMRKVPHFRRISTPGHRVFSGSTSIKKSRNGTGIYILSTPKGVITGYEARALKVGGEVIGEVY